MEETKKCKHCQSEIDKKEKICPNCRKKQSNVTKNVILGVIGFIFFCAFVLTISDSSPVSNNNTETTSPNKINSTKIEVVDFSTMSKEEIKIWSNNNKVTCNFLEEYSDTVEKGLYVRQSKNVGDKIYQGTSISIVYSIGKEPSTEFKNALKKAESYSKIMHMSKQGIYKQLTSEYGEKFPTDAAQYAIDNINADWNANALAKAKSYQTTMNMSKSAIFDQLISQYGEQFTREEAQYAIDHLED